MTESTRIQAVGKCTGEMVKQNDWSEFHIDIGRQYPIKLETKLPSLKDEARAQIGVDGVVWTYDESDGAPNPNRPGTFYKNRRLHSVGGQIDANLAPKAAAGGSQPGPTPPPSGGARDESIERQVIVKAVLPLLGSESIPDWAAAMKAIQELDEFMGKPRVKPEQNKNGEGQTEVPPAPKPTTVPAPAGGYENPDDIPFAPSVF